MENEADVDQRVLHYELEDLPNMRIHDLHSRHSNLGHRAMAQVVFLPRPEITK